MTAFGGWEMPLSYKGIIHEHQAVRQEAGIFDVSHMGRICIEGPDAEKLLDFLSTNRILGKSVFSATYTVWPHSHGGSVDDLLVYKQDPTHFFVIVNAANRQKDLDHLLAYQGGYDLHISDCYQTEGILAVQGPQALEQACLIWPEVAALSPKHFLNSQYEGKPLILSRTGYTGAGGLEIYAPLEVIPELWDRFLKQGVEPVGLGARDTLRLEMGYALYGHELSDQIAPTESVSAWTVKWDRRDFLGKEALIDLEQSPQKRSEYGLLLREPGIAREGHEVFKGDLLIGTITSGTYSPSLQQAIAIALVAGPLQKGEEVNIHIRQKIVKAQVVALPFFNP